MSTLFVPFDRPLKVRDEDGDVVRVSSKIAPRIPFGKPPRKREAFVRVVLRDRPMST